MKIANLLTLLVLLFVLTLTSCKSYKKVIYFQDVKYSNGKPESIKNFQPITIQTSDILSVSVTSLNPLAYNDSIGRVVGYSVDKDGNIKLPLLGKVPVAGQTTSQAEEQIQTKLKPFLKNAEVIVHMKNFKISVMGDVARPNVYEVTTDRVTITEALSMAGDLNITAQSNNLLLVRENDGKREYIPIDLTTAKVFDSPYFYLKHNDMIYVQPDKTKYAAVDGGVRTFSLVLSTLSIIAVLFTTLK
ncbi:MAG: polysaccharide export protein [Pedobacter sp.]|nr:MAG: polysaccharide export protein [Pedobacter sp.]